jgi:hypothetical protein
MAVLELIDGGVGEASRSENRRFELGSIFGHVALEADEGFFQYGSRHLLSLLSSLKLPEAGNTVGIEGRISTDDRHFLCQRLGDQ